MAVAWVSAGAVGGGTSGNASPGMPSGWALNDILILVVVSRDNVAHTVTTGWTQYFQASNGTSERFSVWWRRAQTGDSAPIVTHAAGSAICAQIAAFRGCIGANSGQVRSPFDTGSSVTLVSTTSGTNTITGITTAVANAMVVAVWGHGHATNASEARAYSSGGVTTTAATIVRTGSSTTRAVVQFAYGVRAAAGATGNQVFSVTTVTPTSTYRGNSFLIALAPAVSQTISAGAVVVGTATKTATADAFVLLGLGPGTGHTYPITLPKSPGVASRTATVSGAALVQVTVAATASAGALVRASLTQTVDAGALVQTSTSQSVTAGALVRTSLVSTATAGALVQTALVKTLTANAVAVNVGVTSTITAGALVRTTLTQTASAAALVQTTRTEAVPGAALVLTSRVTEIEAGAIAVETTQTQTVEAGAVVVSPLTHYPWKPPVHYRLSPVPTPTPEPFTICTTIGILAEAPANPATHAMVVTVGGAARTRVTGAPSAGQYQVATVAGEHLPLLYFHASDEGLSGTCSYYRAGTIITREFFLSLVEFLRPMTGYGAVNELPPPAMDRNTRGHPGDVAFLTDGSIWSSDGASWYGVGV